MNVPLVVVRPWEKKGSLKVAMVNKVGEEGTSKPWKVWKGGTIPVTIPTGKTYCVCCKLHYTPFPNQHGLCVGCKQK